MVKKKGNKDIERKESTVGKSPKAPTGKTASKKTLSGEVKGPKGTGKGATPSEKATDPGGLKLEDTPKKLPGHEALQGLPEHGTPDRQEAPGKPSAEAKPGKAGKVPAKNKGTRAGKKMDSSVGVKKAKENKADSTTAKEKADKPTPTRKPAKKMSRTKTRPGISAEEKMKMPNSSPGDELKKAARSARKAVSEKLTPDQETRQKLEEKAREMIPDPEELKGMAGSMAEKVIEGSEKAKEYLKEILPDEDEIKKEAQEVMNKDRNQEKQHQKGSEEQPAEASLLTAFDIHLFREGKHYHLYNKLGAHPMTYMGTKGVYFAVWAPNAEYVSVIGSFNNWNRENHRMNSRWDHSGIWEIFIPGAKKGDLYKYFIRSNSGYEVEKGDPYAFRWETPPHTASLVWDLENTWNDKKWMTRRMQNKEKAQPYSVYELHLGSWKRMPEDGYRSLSYAELAEDLPAYLKEMGFTHVEFMPVMEHPFFGSWGYQITGYFAPSSRFGSPQEFMYLIDRLHQEGIGVILDWVPSHFPSDQHGLHYFDGTHLYEHEDPQKGFHPDWQSYIFNYGRNEVRSFLISNALFWLDKFHCDGLRVDAVASMLYLDYSRKHGEWQPNVEGGRENLEAISFLKEFNEVVYREYPDTITIAEESTAWPMVSKPTYMGGLGFGMKWMMGWMHDTLEYFSKDPIHRRHHQNTITFSLNYAFSENFMLPLSHDEVVYGKGSILNKMPGDQWNRFANLRTLYSYMYAHPGAKLLFMGAEFAQASEWNHDSSLEWHLAGADPHRKIQETLKELNRLYKNEPALYEKAFTQEGFEWVDLNDAENSIISFIRKGNDSKDDLLVICNFTPVPRENYRLGMREKGSWQELFNSDNEAFGGSGVRNDGAISTQELGAHGKDHSLSLTLPPLGVLYLKKSGA